MIKKNKNQRYFNQKGYIGLVFIIILSSMIIFLISLLSMLGFAFSKKTQLNQVSEIALEGAVKKYLDTLESELKEKTAQEIEAQLKQDRLKPLCTANINVRQELENCINTKLTGCTCLKKVGSKCQVKISDCWSENDDNAPPNVVKERFKDEILALSQSNAEQAIIKIFRKNFNTNNNITIQDFEIDDDLGIMTLRAKNRIELTFFNLDIVEKELTTTKTIQFSIK